MSNTLNWNPECLFRKGEYVVIVPRDALKQEEANYSCMLDLAGSILKIERQVEYNKTTLIWHDGLRHFRYKLTSLSGDEYCKYKNLFDGKWNDFTQYYYYQQACENLFNYHDNAICWGEHLLLPIYSLSENQVEAYESMLMKRFSKGENIWNDCSTLAI